jgi:hypothetical protein
MFMGFAREQFRTRFSNAAVELWWKHLFRVVASPETKREAVQKRSSRKPDLASPKSASGPRWQGGKVPGLSALPTSPELQRC